MAYIKGVDVSSAQTTTFDLSGSAFGFVKFTQGTTYVNPKATAQVAHVRSASDVVGKYHFFLTGNVQAQANYFVSKSAVKPGDVLACDWETDPATKKHASGAEKDAFIKAVKKLCPNNRVGLYCNKDFWKNIDTTSYCGDFLWIADPDSAAGSPDVTHAWTFHQYGISGGMDRNVANFPTRLALSQWTLGDDDDVALTTAEAAALAMIPDLVKTVNALSNDVMSIKSLDDGKNRAIGYYAATNVHLSNEILALLQDPAGLVAKLESLKITIGE